MSTVGPSSFKCKTTGFGIQHKANFDKPNKRMSGTTWACLIQTGSGWYLTLPLARHPSGWPGVTPGQVLFRQMEQLFDKYACWVWFGSALFGLGVTHLGAGASLYKDPNLYWRLLSRRLQLTWHGPWHPRRQWHWRGDDRTGIGVRL